MLGNEVIAVTALGLSAGKETQGHRFEAAVSPVILRDADSYSEQLKTEGAVIASFSERRAEIARQLNDAAAKENLKPIDDEALLDEVTALVERPNVLLGQFEEIYLEVPQECLILTMKANQKYFPLLNANGKLTNKFLIVSNISPDDASAVIGGNERVVRPRLADAKFFFDQDRKKTLASRISGLEKVSGFFARLSQPVNFDSIDNKPVDLVFMLLAPESAGADHLHALATVSRILRNEKLCEHLRTAKDEAEIYRILVENTERDTAEPRKSIA